MEVKKVYQYVKFKDVDVKNGEFSIKNNYMFTNLDEYEAVWELRRDGDIVDSGVFVTELAPNKSKIVKLPFGDVVSKNGEEYWLNVAFRLKEDTKWAKKGHIVAKEQFRLPVESKGEVLSLNEMKSLSYSDKGDRLVVTGDSFEVTISKEKGSLDSFKVKGKELIEKPMIPNYWRAPNDNDKGNGAEERLATWKFAGKEAKVVSTSVTPIEDKGVRVDVKLEIPTTTPAQLDLQYVVFGNGEVKVTNTLYTSKDLPEIPEFGMMMEMPEKYDTVTWYGRGPEENYVDRKTGYNVGVYSANVDDFFFPYIDPSETGNRVDTRWVTLTAKNGVGLLASGVDNTIEFNALHYTPEELSSGKRHPVELVPTENVVLRINGKQQGVGGDDSWGAVPHDQYQIKSGKAHTYSFKLKGITKADNPMEISKRNIDSDLIKDIKVNGVSLKDFDKNITDYKVEFLAGTEKQAPVVEVEYGNKEDVIVSIEQANSVEKGKAKVVVAHKDKALNEVLRKEYTINFGTHNIVYASDLPFEKATSGMYKVERDITVSGSVPHLRLEDGSKVRFEKAICANSDSEVVINLKGKGFKRFKSYVGMDREVIGYRTKAQFRVLLDGKEVFNSGEMASSVRAKEVDI